MLIGRRGLLQPNPIPIVAISHFYVQATRYAARHGLKYMVVTIYTWTWILIFPSPNHMQIGPPLIWSNGAPTIIQVRGMQDSL